MITDYDKPNWHNFVRTSIGGKVIGVSHFRILPTSWMGKKLRPYALKNLTVTSAVTSDELKK